MLEANAGRRLSAVLAAVCGAVLLSVACTQHMATQPSYRPYQPTDFFADGTSARTSPADTVARGHLADDPLLFTGKTADGQLATDFPYAVTRDVLDRGRQRFEIACVPCHGFAGAGDGMVVQRGFSPPPTFHSDRLRQAPVGHFFDVMTNGFGAMPEYATQVTVQDRWAIVAYIRALQLSQAAPLAAVPAEEQARLEQEP